MPWCLKGRLPVLATAGLLAVPLFGAGTAAAAVTSTSTTPDSTLAGTRPAWATPTRERAAVPSGSSVTFRVQLRLRDAATAEAVATAVSTPGSRSYGHYLTARQFDARFAPAASSVSRVRSMLRAEGFSVGGSPSNRLWVEATGTAAQVKRAFGAQENTYAYRGHHLRAPDRDLRIPHGMADVVQTVTGLDQGSRLRAPASHRPVGASGPQTKAAAAKCSDYWGQHHQQVPEAYGGQDSFPTYICGYVPDQFQTAYGTKAALARGTTGKGVTVAIVDAYASPTMLKDANAYAGLTGQAAFAKGQYTEKTFKPFNLQDECGGEAGWNGEETLDVEAVHGMAPGAKVAYFGAKNCDTGLDDAVNYINEHHSADLVSNSYGNLGEDIPASYITAEHRIYLQSKAEGIGVYFSSGDSGDEVTVGNTTAAQPDYPASDPNVTAVGGTSVAIDSGGAYSFETGWGTDLDLVTADGKGYAEALPGSFRFGAGGGTSTLWAQPAYQKGTVPDALARKFGGKRMRVVPDVALDADPYTGMLVGQTDPDTGTFGTYAIGGTSLACPLFAGVQALVSQGGHHVGFANPALYSLAGSQAYRDVTPSRSPIGVTNPTGTYLVTLDRDSTLQTTAGYDDVTGMGTPRGGTFIARERAAG